MVRRPWSEIDYEALVRRSSDVVDSYDDIVREKAAWESRPESRSTARVDNATRSLRNAIEDLRQVLGKL